MKKLIIVFLILFIAPISWACSCNAGDVAKKYTDHVSIFQGTVTEVIFYDSEDSFGDQHIKVTFEIEKQWKGEPSQKQLFTVFNRASCFGYWFKEKERYIVYAFEEGESLNAWWCGGVIPESENTVNFELEIKVLNEVAKNPLNKALNSDGSCAAARLAGR